MWNIALAAGALLAFRFFDISKIPPAHQLQRLPSGWGVLLDDVMAGVYALIVLQAILIFI
jgi:phosphatidylglycerophosphatase A